MTVWRPPRPCFVQRASRFSLPQTPPPWPCISSNSAPSVVVAENALAHGLGSPGVPVLLLLGAQESVDLEEVESWRVADYLINPVRPGGELVHRVETLIGRAKERARSRGEIEALRESLRNVSSAIRQTNDPQLIAEHVVRGFGEALGADHVWFATFRDERVPPSIRAQWNRPGLPLLPARLGESENIIIETANRLWAEADVLAVADHREDPDSKIAKALQEWSGELKPISTVLLPVGEGASAMGIILLSTVQERHDWTRAEIALMQHVAGNVAHGLIQGHLISAQQRVLHQLRQLDKAKTDFLATVNHELRTPPLTSITAYLDMIQDGSGGPVPEGIRKMLDVIARNSDRLRRLIEDMLTVSMQDGSNLDLKPVDLDKLLQVVVATLRPLAESRHVSVSFTEANEDIEVTADEAKLEQVFTNIVANAIKFTPEGGRVGITSAWQLPRMAGGQPCANRRQRPGHPGTRPSPPHPDALLPRVQRHLCGSTGQRIGGAGDRKRHHQPPYGPHGL